MCSLPVLFFGVLGFDVEEWLGWEFPLTPALSPTVVSNLRLQVDCGGEGDAGEAFSVLVVVVSESSGVGCLARIRVTETSLFRESANVSSNGQAGAL